MPHCVTAIEGHGHPPWSDADGDLPPWAWRAKRSAKSWPPRAACDKTVERAGDISIPSTPSMDDTG